QSALEELRKNFSRYVGSFKDQDTPLVSGIIGFFSYDHGLKQEGLKNKSTDGLIPDCLFGFYDVIITIDHVLEKIHITSTGLPEQNSFLREKRAAERLNHVLQLFKGPLKKEKEIDPLRFEEHIDLTLQSNFTKESYFSTVERALDYI